MSELVRAGAGIALLPRFYVDAGLADGSVVALLPDYTLDLIYIHALFVPGRDRLPKVRLFIDALRAHFGAI